MIFFIEPLDPIPGAGWAHCPQTLRRRAMGRPVTLELWWTFVRFLKEAMQILGTGNVGRGFQVVVHLLTWPSLSVPISWPLLTTVSGLNNRYCWGLPAANPSGESKERKKHLHNRENLNKVVDSFLQLSSSRLPCICRIGNGMVHLPQMKHSLAGH